MFTPLLYYVSHAQKWKDVRLTWEPALYGNVTSVRISPLRVWIPDITMYNE